MPHTSSLTFLREFDKKLWTAADKKGAQASCLFLQDQKGAQASRLSLHWKCHLTAKMAVPLFDQWARGAHLRRAPRARRVRLRRKQPNQSNPTTWRLAAMNMAESLPRQSETATGGLPRHSATTPGIDFDFGKEPADTFTRDQHPDRSLSRQSTATPDADFVMALPSAAARSLPRSHPADRPNGRINPPFNIKEWWDGKREGDARWKYGTPPQTAMRECAPLKSEGTPQVVSEARDKNANFAWVQHMLQNLSRHSAATTNLAPNGSMSSNSSGEGDIRRALIEADRVECMVALPGQLFTNTQIPACIWFLTKNKAKRSCSSRRHPQGRSNGIKPRMATLNV